MSRDISELEQMTGYSFKDKELLENALRHSSYANEHKKYHLKDNERLEFLGDAVLELSSSEYLYRHYPKMKEGEMTKLRASIVCEPTLAQCAAAIELGSFLRLGRGEEQTGGRHRDSVVSDAMEALIGAIFLDGGFTSAKEFVNRFILNGVEHKKLFFDSKTILQEIVQSSYKGEAMSYHLLREEGPEHDKTFVVQLFIGDKGFEEGRGRTKKSAEQEAAYRTMMILKGQQ
ncbi:ribonuclease III [Marvinbryantia formatexigens DSM 14469]|uniref:Ribonuclease 3 n=1 Tax=Marvinbryantia formatexigens DSM 14469 TaxID=478749 RepID=C6LCP3_9FIRM|nr:ribonuclease III [Marvinbryantia formatexigens]EET61707.1 ribonuclease III [Marvinbryantia formatexigens DSM 14469]UWO24479.1 ribonuclease III [Marvinbryantia formatexigens DSM 14469]SDF09759.1 ribonuclease-3 [Marvinbryantia formatexigens]